MHSGWINERREEGFCDHTFFDHRIRSKVEMKMNHKKNALRFFDLFGRRPCMVYRIAHQFKGNIGSIEIDIWRWKKKRRLAICHSKSQLFYLKYVIFFCGKRGARLIVLILAVLFFRYVVQLWSQETMNMQQAICWKLITA